MRHFSSVFPITFEVPGTHDERTGDAIGEPVDIIRQFAFGLAAQYEKPAGQHFEVATDFGSDEASDQPEIVAIRVLVPKNSPPAWPNGPPVVFYNALEALVAINIWCIRARMHGIMGPGKGSYPDLYESVCYKPKVQGTEELWDSIEALHQRGHGVCEDLACARVAERRIIGDPCRPNLISQKMPDGILYHVMVQNPDGSNEDPSGELGMNLGKENDLTSPRCRLLLSKKA